MGRGSRARGGENGDGEGGDDGDDASKVVPGRPARPDGRARRLQRRRVDPRLFIEARAVAVATAKTKRLELGEEGEPSRERDLSV